MTLTTAVIIIVVALVAVAFWIRSVIIRSHEEARTKDQSLTLLQNQVTSLTEQITRSVSDTRASMDSRLDNAARVISDVKQQLGKLEESSKRMADVGKDLADLQNILRSPKLRGNIGELILSDLLAQLLPVEHFQLQYGFRSGEAVDAVIRLKAGLVPVDAKFPLENFRRVAAATTDDERKTLKKAFIKDVKIHVDAIAKKYIRTDEGTLDFALMYVPAENVYYETIIRDDEADSALFQYALARRVIPVSPNSFYAYLQTILLGLRGLKVEESALAILRQITRLNTEFEKFADAFRLIGKHLNNSVQQFQDADKRREKIGEMVRTLDRHDDQPALPEPAESELPTLGK